MIMTPSCTGAVNGRLEGDGSGGGEEGEDEREDTEAGSVRDRMTFSLVLFPVIPVTFTLLLFLPFFPCLFLIFTFYFTYSLWCREDRTQDLVDGRQPLHHCAAPSAPTFLLDRPPDRPSSLHCSFSPPRDVDGRWHSRAHLGSASLLTFSLAQEPFLSLQLIPLGEKL